MRAIAILTALILAGCAQSQPLAQRGRIVSVNPCADALLVRLAAPERIGAISHYSHDAGATSLPLAVARQFPATAGTAEEVIALAPELVLADTFTPAATLDAYRRAGLKVLVLGSVNSIADSIAQVREVAAAVDGHARGEALAREIAAAAALPPPAGPRPAALFYITGSFANGTGNLIDALLTTAGFRNAAADHSLVYSGTVPVERLVARPPQVVIATEEGRSTALRRRLLPGVVEAAFPRTLVNCGGPSIPPALARLRAIRDSL